MKFFPGCHRVSSRPCLQCKSNVYYYVLYSNGVLEPRVSINWKKTIYSYFFNTRFLIFFFLGRWWLFSIGTGRPTSFSPRTIKIFRCGISSAPWRRRGNFRRQQSQSSGPWHTFRAQFHSSQRYIADHRQRHSSKNQFYSLILWLHKKMNEWKNTLRIFWGWKVESPLVRHFSLVKKRMYKLIKKKKTLINKKNTRYS